MRQTPDPADLSESTDFVEDLPKKWLGITRLKIINPRCSSGYLSAAAERRERLLSPNSIALAREVSLTLSRKMNEGELRRAARIIDRAFLKERGALARKDRVKAEQEARDAIRPLDRQGPPLKANPIVLFKDPHPPRRRRKRRRRRK